MLHKKWYTQVQYSTKEHRVQRFLICFGTKNGRKKMPSGEKHEKIENLAKKTLTCANRWYILKTGFESCFLNPQFKKYIFLSS